MFRFRIVSPLLVQALSILFSTTDALLMIIPYYRSDFNCYKKLCRRSWQYINWAVYQIATHLRMRLRELAMRV